MTNRANPVEPLLVNEHQVARLLSLSPRSVWSLSKNGDLPVVWIGKAKRYHIRDIEAFIEARKHAGKGAET